MEEGSRKRSTDDFGGAGQDDEGPSVAEAPLLLVVSSTFENEHPIPVDYTRDGDDHSPRLGWANIPRRTQSFALVCEDPEGAAGKAFVHWVIFNIPRVAKGIPFCELSKGVSKAARPPEVPGASQGRNDFGELGYSGPASARGREPRRYHFRLYALDTVLTLPAGTSAREVRRAMRGHVVGYGELVGTYGRRQEEEARRSA
jgi:hypothetical protein